MDWAKRTAELSYAKRLQVGAVIVKDDTVISYGYNGMPSGWDNECEQCCDGGGPAYSLGCYHDHCTGPVTKPEVLHAESNAIAKLARSSNSGLDASIFITHSPCIDCAKLIYQAGIKEVYYADDYRSSDGIEFLKKSNVNVKQINK